MDKLKQLLAKTCQELADVEKGIKNPLIRPVIWAHYDRLRKEQERAAWTRKMDALNAALHA